MSLTRTDTPEAPDVLRRHVTGSIGSLSNEAVGQRITTAAQRCSVKTTECQARQCPVCGTEVGLRLSLPAADPNCPTCGTQLWCSRRVIDDVVVLDAVSGRTPETHDIDRLLQSLMCFGDGPRVVLNLSRLDYTTSTIVACLVGLKSRIDSATGGLILCGLRPIPREVFARTRLDTFFDIFDSETEALASFHLESVQPFA